MLPAGGPVEDFIVWTAFVSKPWKQQVTGGARCRPVLHMADRPTLPRILWSYWHDGEPPLVVQQCLRSWSVQAADWDVRFLNLSNVRAWLTEGIDVPPSTWLRSPQHQSDMIGLALLRRFGGVWIDASALLTKPLNWLWDEWGRMAPSVDFLGYVSGSGSPEIFFYASLARGVMLQHWWSELYALWDRCPELQSAGCVDRYSEQKHTRGAGWSEVDLHLHPGSVGHWVLQSVAAARAAFRSLGTAASGPYLLMERAIERRPIGLKSELVATFSRLPLPLPADVRDTPMHKVQGAATQTSATPAPQSWWAELLRLSITQPHPPLSLAKGRGPCRVVVEPMLGFGNRLRMLASAYIFAARHGCAFYVNWIVAQDMPHLWEELFASRAVPPPFPYQAPAWVHTHAWLESVAPHAVHAVVFRGGASRSFRP
jgi:hypothetical protein